MPVAIPVFPPPPTGEIPGEFSNEFSAEVDKAHDFWKETVPAFTRQKSNRALKAVGKRHDFSDVGDDFKLPAGSVKKGKRFFKKYCMQCHSIYVDNRVSTGGQITLGPTMWEVCGRASGMGDVQATSQRRVMGILWTDAALMNYMKSPRVVGEERDRSDHPSAPRTTCSSCSWHKRSLVRSRVPVHVSISMDSNTSEK